MKTNEIVPTTLMARAVSLSLFDSFSANANRQNDADRQFL